jgi:cardiolipin hydrolase
MGCKPFKAKRPPNEVFFFPDAKLPCQSWFDGAPCRWGDNCKYAHTPTNLTRLCTLLKGSCRSIDICVFTITCDFITRRILEAHGRGVQVRVISDAAQALNRGSDIAALQAAGVPLRTDKSATHMHHKFCIIDKTTLLNGSFNWTVQAVTGNAENVVVIHEPETVRAFTKEFDKLWQAYA